MEAGRPSRSPTTPMTRSHVPIIHKKKEPKPKSRLQRGGRIKPVSAKMAQINKIYRALKLKFLQEHPYCQHFMAENGIDEKVAMDNLGIVLVKKDGEWKYINVPKSCEVHHMKGRGKYHLDVSTWMAVRAGHADFIHGSFTAESYAKGYMLPRT